MAHDCSQVQMRFEDHDKHSSAHVDRSMQALGHYCKWLSHCAVCRCSKVDVMEDCATYDVSAVG